MVNNKFPSYVGAMRYGIIGSLLSAAVLCGCSSEKPLAVIDDLSSSQYRVVEVDGKPVKRTPDTFSPATFVPYAYISPGCHALTVSKNADLNVGSFTVVVPNTGTVVIAKKMNMGAGTVTFTANLEAGKRYRIAATGASVVEMENRH